MPYWSDQPTRPLPGFEAYTAYCCVICQHRTISCAVGTIVT